MSRRKFLRSVVIGTGAAVAVATGTDQVFYGGVGTNYAAENIRSPEVLQEPRLVQPTILLDGEKRVKYDLEMIKKRTDLVMHGVKRFFEKKAGFTFNVTGAKTVILEGHDRNIFNTPTNMREPFAEAAQQNARKHTTPQPGTTVGVFAPDFESSGGYGIANTDGRYFALFDTASQALTQKDATYGQLYTTARELIHEFSHTLGIEHPESKDEVSLTSPGVYVGPDYSDPSNPNYRDPQKPLEEEDIVNWITNLDIQIHEDDREKLHNLYDKNDTSS